jgi:hypothetical protein
MNQSFGAKIIVEDYSPEPRKKTDGEDDVVYTEYLNDGKSSSFTQTNTSKITVLKNNQGLNQKV